MTIGNQYVESDLDALKTLSRTLERTCLALDDASDLSVLLRILAGPAIEAGAIEVILDHIDVDHLGRPEWAKTVATWQQPGQPPIPTNVRYHISDFPGFKLWIANPQSPLYVADIRTDERLDENTREVFLESQQRAIVVIPLRHTERWVGLLFFAWDQPHIFSQHERTVYKVLAKLAFPIIENYCQFSKLGNKLALRDKVLRQVAGRYRELFDVSPHGIAYVDLDGHLIECNQAYLDMLGYTSMVEVQRASVCCEMQCQLVREAMLEQTSAGGSSAAQLRPAEYCQKNGQPVRLLVQTWLSRNRKGDPIGMWISCHAREGEKA